jgi:hypothetical protein
LFPPRGRILAPPFHLTATPPWSHPIAARDRRAP